MIVFRFELFLGFANSGGIKTLLNIFNFPELHACVETMLGWMGLMLRTRHNENKWKTSLGPECWETMGTLISIWTFFWQLGFGPNKAAAKWTLHWIHKAYAIKLCLIVLSCCHLAGFDLDAREIATTGNCLFPNRTKPNPVKPCKTYFE